MKLFTHHRRNVISTLLLGLLTLVTTMSVQAAGPPVANASRSTNITGTVPLTVHFDGSLSTCPNGCTKPDSYSWVKGEVNREAPPPSTGVRTDITYSFDGVYTATLTVTDDTGLKSTAKVTVTVNLPPGETLTSYVQACQNQLGFQSIPDNISCYSGDLFAVGDPVRDFLGYQKLTDQVDMAFVCRWLQGDPSNPSAPISIEMLVHNRSNGNTCFFSAKGFISDRPGLTSATIRSPTSSAATTFWDSPAAVNQYARCVGCHIEGAFIATPNIAPYLAKYGLLNNGHDTGSNITYNDLTVSFNKAHVKYHAVVTPNTASVFSQWDNLKQSYMDPGPTCSLGCHVIGTLSPQPDIGQTRRGFDVILANPASELSEINNAGVMEPWYQDTSDYRWINLDTAGDGVESESFTSAIAANTTLVPQLFGTYSYVCPQPNVPTAMEAHAVGVPGNFAFNTVQMAQLPDRLRTFNLKEGLVCLNADQEQGHQCGEYSVRYLCSVNNQDGTPTWSGWYNTDSASGDGDHEERSRHLNICGGNAPIAIQAEEVTPGNKPIDVMGPGDRLARFSPYGLTCNNSEQVDGQCSNYVVRYDACTSPPPTQLSKRLVNVFVAGKQVTAANSVSLAKGQSQNGGGTQQWNTQQWNLEPITNTEYVRVHNPGTNVYLTVTSNAEQATVGIASLNTSINEMWTIETVSGSSAFRLKNLYSGKYLTIADPKNVSAGEKDFLPIYSQGLNTGWTSQLWLIQ